MTALNVAKVFEGLPRVWAGFLQDWDRTMRSRNHPDTTRYNYELAAAQLARYQKEHSPDIDSDAAADDPTLVAKGQVEAFQAWVVETRSASTTLNMHKALQQFFKWLVIDEEEADRSRWTAPASPRPSRSSSRCSAMSTPRRSSTCVRERPSRTCATTRSSPAVVKTVRPVGSSILTPGRRS
ncbi:phage integrase N-terminal SAM-like domain-containing protein [Catellatospora methionotrophica]|uniref:phage integrase N-terminal SAM-like domain-containing protein n=1 Tax=Catellatospora methionotrophica TaxID=121620 RepID=UPI0033CA7A5C